MKKKPHSTLWLYFAAIIFIILLVTAFIMVGVAFTMFHLGFFHRPGNSPLFPIIGLLFFSVVIGTAVSLVVAKKILKPITKLSEASAEVARGNFNIQLDDLSHISEIHDLTANFNMMIHELSSIETLRNDFVSNISHEFKTPIAAIEGYATLLQDPSLSMEEHKDYTQMVIESVRQLSSLSGNVLSLSKLENQEIPLNKQNFRLDEQLRESILMLEPEWSAKNLELLIELDKLSCFGDEGLLLLVWKNLIDNAVKFTPPGGSVSIRLYMKDSLLIITVADTGCGIDSKSLRHVFDKFYQSDITRKANGNGLGLTLARRIVELHNGQISVESELNSGTIFTVWLPLN